MKAEQIKMIKNKIDYVVKKYRKNVFKHDKSLFIKDNSNK